MNVNKVILIGNLTRDPEVIISNSGTKICKLSLATNEFFTKDGEKKQITDFHNVTFFGAVCKIVEMAKKGQTVLVEEKNKSGSYTDKSKTKK